MIAVISALRTLANDCAWNRATNPLPIKPIRKQLMVVNFNTFVWIPACRQAGKGRGMPK
jgi:hypothetical protein